MERKGEFSSYNDAKGSFADAKWHAADSKEYAKQSDISMQELKLDQETEDEFQRLKAAPKSLVVEKSSNPRNLRVVDGFKMYVERFYANKCIPCHSVDVYYKSMLLCTLM